ncbi:MAG: C40 family peptidase [Myxococcales bacterium]|nr:C40 family peptidase [Myxococcales bacterium]MCB9672426.1 C40 family peptidase [Alphaproteobacteria bacterium]MCB9693067.1 C40 family peptidase [Alphaproteobacteria bacterium]
MLLTLLALTAEASRSMKIPGPLGPVAKDRPAPLHVRDLPREPAPATPDPAPEPEKPRKARRDDGFGDAVASAARKHLEHAPDGFRNDCSGFVMAAFHRAGMELSGSTRTMWADAESLGITHTDTPRPGDLVFFDNTYDRNRNGRRDDPLTHVGVVIEIGDDGRVVVAHGGTSKGRTTLVMDTRHPHDRLGPDGEVRNDWLRARQKGDDDRVPRLAGELFRGYARYARP